MDKDDKRESPEEAFRRARRLLRETRTRARLATAPPMLATLERERFRSQRHNHYFAVVVLSSPDIETAELLRAAGHTFRASDLVGLLDGEGRYLVVDRCGGEREEFGFECELAGSVAVVLPETDWPGAECAVSRLGSALGSGAQFRFGLAVYPVDGTDSAELLRKAAG